MHRTITAALAVLLTAATQSWAGGKVVTLHEFDGTGYAPEAGIVVDGAGNIFGNTSIGGTGPCLADAGCGTIFRLVPPADPHAAWTYQTLYNFQGGQDGYSPRAPLTLDDGGVIYGYPGGGTFGTVFRLQPPASEGGDWTFQILYVFQGHTDGDLLNVASPLLAAGGQIYGIASGGGSSRCGANGCGSVFRLSPGAPDAPWTKEILFSFTGGAHSGQPQWLAGLDATGSLYVTTNQGKGAVVKLSPPESSGRWTESVIATFAGGLDGRAPSNLVLRPDGTLFGLAVGTRQNGNLVYRLTPNRGRTQWTRSVVAYVKDHGYGPDSLALGKGGTLIGAIEGDFDFFSGSLFQLTPAAVPSAPWVFTELWNFNRGPDRNPLNAVVGSGGKIFSVLFGGDSSSGSVVELR